MRKLLSILFGTLLLLGTLVLIPGMNCRASTYIANEKTGYEAVIHDSAGLLSQYEHKRLMDTMMPITEYGHVIFLSLDSVSHSSKKQAEDFCRQLYGSDNAVVFFINMDARELYIYSNEDLYHTITQSHALTITDNVYRHASAGDYYSCAHKAFSQIYRVLGGDPIPQPMKYICNALLAMILALLLGFGWVCVVAFRYRPGKRILMEHTPVGLKASVTHTECTDTHFLTEEELYGDGLYIFLQVLRFFISLGGGGGFSGGGFSGSGKSGGGRSGSSRGGGGGHRF